MRRALVVDKSFAHHISDDRKAALPKDYLILIPNAFFYEVSKTDLEKRWKATKFFPEFDMLHLPTLLRKEKKQKQPLVEIGFTPHYFDQAFVCGLRRFSKEESQIFQDYEGDILSFLLTFFREVIEKGVIGFSGTETEKVVKGTFEEFGVVCRRLCDVECIREICALMKMPIAEILDESWLYFRYIQGLAIYGLSLIRSYHGQVDSISDQKLIHEIHDLEYLVLGLHAGALATVESEDDYRKMGWKFRLLAPNGLLVKY